MNVGEEVSRFARERDVLLSIEPNTLVIDDGLTQPVIHLELNCDWEEEHGMEWIVRDGQVVYVGPYNGMNPLSDFAGDAWSFA
jgi:hypothetical protein